MLVARIIPGISYLIPWYILFRHLKMMDTYQALILTHLVVGLPITIWVMIGFFEDVPPSWRRALIDGCSYYGVFWRVALPWSSRAWWRRRSWRSSSPGIISCSR